jgi:hypothetical protein
MKNGIRGMVGLRGFTEEGKNNFQPSFMQAFIKIF